MIDLALSIPVLTYATFLGAAMMLYLTPGADMMFTIASGMRGGPQAGVAAAAGISLGSFCHSLIAAAGLAVVLLAYPLAYDAIRYAGAAYLIWLAWVAWNDTTPPATRQGNARVLRAFGRGLMTNILNPKVALFVLAFLPQFTDPALGPVWQQIIVLGAILGTVGFALYALLGMCAGLAASRMQRASRWMGKAAAIVFGGLAVRLVLD